MDGIKPAITPDEALLQKSMAGLKTAQRDAARAREAGEDFESLFVFFMLKTMRRTIMKSGLLEGGLSADVMESLFDQNLSKQIAMNTPLGIAEMLQQNLLPDSAADRPSGTPKLRSAPLRRSKTSSRAPYQESTIEGRLAAFRPHIKSAAEQFDVPEELIRAVILAESSGNPRAVSPRGARGLMQLMDATAREAGVSDAFDPGENIRGGTRYLSELLKQFKGNRVLALSAYNAGPQAVKRYGGVPPYEETREYVQRVLKYFHKFRGKPSAVQVAGQ